MSRGGKGVPGKPNAPSDAETKQLEEIAKWTLREDALRGQLQSRSTQVEASRREERELKESLRLLTQAFEECRAERYDIVSDFTRQYKATLEALIKVVTTTDGTITELRDQQELAKIALVQTEKEKDHFIALKDREIDEQTKRIQEMDEEFNLMLEDMNRKMETKVQAAVKAANQASDESSDEDEGDGAAAAAAASGGDE